MKNRTIQKRRAREFIKKFDFKDFPEEHTYDLSYTVACFMIPRLKAFKKHTISYPYPLTPQKWDEVIQKIIDGFEIYTDQTIVFHTEEQNQKINEALDLFRKWFRDLWW